MKNLSAKSISKQGQQTRSGPLRGLRTLLQTPLDKKPAFLM